MSLLLSGCPGSWGIEDANDPNNTSFNIVLDEISKSGYTATELGPYGYLPQDKALLSDELSKRNLNIIAGTLYDDLVSSSNSKKLIEKTHTTCKLLNSIEKPTDTSYTDQYFVLIDEVKVSKQFFAGQPQKADRLDKSQYSSMLSNIKEISIITREEYGVKSVVHNHAGGYIEFEDEIDRLLGDISRDHTGICFDTGHAYYSKIDPVRGINKYADYIDYMHFKDIDKKKYTDSIANNTDFYVACANKVMCPIGDGCLDYTGIKNALNAIGYDGYITIEQDRHSSDTTDVLLHISHPFEHLVRRT
jgi:inosose dehydratase